MWQGGSGIGGITVQYKEFGIRLNFTPTVVGDDRVHLKVRPEVSTLDFANGVDQLLEATNDFRIEVQEVTDLGSDHVLAVLRSAMKGKDSEIEVSQTVFSLMTLHQGLIVRAEEYLHREEALEAAGLRE